MVSQANEEKQQEEKTMKRTAKFMALLMALLLLASCGGESEGSQVKTDDEGEYLLTAQLSGADASEIKEIEEKFCRAATDINAALIVEYIDENAAADEEKLNKIFAAAANEGAKEYVPYKSYYLKDVTIGDVAIRAKLSENDSDYIVVTPAAEEIYAGIYISEGDKVSQTYSLICAKQSGKWKIVWMDSTDIEYYGKDAKEYYELAKKADEKEELLSYIYAQMMYNIKQPGNLYCYGETTEMGDYATQKSVWGSTAFPIEIIPGKKIHNVGIAREENGVVPMVLYHTQVDITNEAALKADAETVKNEFVKKYPYIAEHFSEITVRATNVDPSTATSQYPYESIVLKLK